MVFIHLLKNYIFKYYTIYCLILKIKIVYSKYYSVFLVILDELLNIWVINEATPGFSTDFANKLLDKCYYELCLKFNYKHLSIRISVVKKEYILVVGYLFYIINKIYYYKKLILFTFILVIL